MSIEAPVVGRRRARARVQGTVQGVGFRPYVYRLAGELGLGGFVLNDSHGVLLEVEGSGPAVEEFLSRLGPEAPPLAVLERVLSEEREPKGEHRFAILESPRGGGVNAPVTPDSATCSDCLSELFDPADRRWRYPFTNCTNCGPRFTIVRGIPYDRPYTTMAAFRMCPRCRAEYEDPADRRFHAQPNACPECGPAVSLVGAGGVRESLGGCADPVQAAAAALADGRIVAIKGIGGFHLACRADEDAVVARLRGRKHREDKPFALMARTLQDADRLVLLGDLERQLLLSPVRPIVLAARLEDGAVAAAVAPGSPELGVMLPYSPLHHLLLADFADRVPGPGVALVMTSGNVSDEPIAFGDQDALQRLGGIADLLLVHDRPIQTRTDDSVIRVVQGPGGRRGVVLRRSRGYVPGSLALPGAGTPRHLLACGAELKNTFCVAKGERAWVGHHVGDLKNYETLRSFSEGIEHFERLFAVEPAVIAHDLHPEYLSTKYAFEREGVELIGVQHHHAHLAACLAEHGESGPAIGAIYDGTGYGTDGTVWGGELLYGDLEDFRRVGTLHPVRLPGGEKAIREPWRMACAWLSAGGDGAPAMPAALAARVPERSWGAITELVRTGLVSPPTSSMGRLFDAVAALCGIRPEVNYEGQAAIELEAVCDPAERGEYPIGLGGDGLGGGGLDGGEGLEADRLGGGGIVIDPRETIAAVAADVAAGVRAGVVASRFHRTIGNVTVAACVQAAASHGTEVVILSGGVFQNRRLLEAVAGGLGEAGLRVLFPERLPANDGGISFGQAAVAARRILSR